MSSPHCISLDTSILPKNGASPQIMSYPRSHHSIKMMDPLSAVAALYSKNANNHKIVTPALQQCLPLSSHTSKTKANNHKTCTDQDFSCIPPTKHYWHARKRFQPFQWSFARYWAHPNFRTLSHGSHMVVPGEFSSKQTLKNKSSPTSSIITTTLPLFVRWIVGAFAAFHMAKIGTPTITRHILQALDVSTKVPATILVFSIACCLFVCVCPDASLWDSTSHWKNEMINHWRFL